MDTRTERLLTWLIAGGCLLTAAVQQFQRLTPAYVPVTSVQPDLQVSIAGAVARPGVYSLDWGAVVADLVSAAGGFTAEAETELVSPARPLAQGDSVFVPSVSTEDPLGRVSLNSADSWGLQRLPGVGPALAERIIAARPFNSVEELLDVSGIGPATFARLQPLVRP